MVVSMKYQPGVSPSPKCVPHPVTQVRLSMCRGACDRYWATWLDPIFTQPSPELLVCDVTLQVSR